MPPDDIANDWKQLLLGTAATLEGRFDQLRQAVKAELGWLDPVTILPYRGYGDGHRLRLRGRVLEAKSMAQPRPGLGTWDNFLRMLQRFETDEVAGARLRASFGGWSGEIVADEEGYFELAVDLAAAPEPGRRWLEVGLELLAPVQPAPVRAVGEVLVPDPAASLAVISDIDDTILKTGAYDLIRNWRTVLLHSAESRIPFRGVAAFYRALQRGLGEAPVNPAFYVSSSPWNIYDLLERFMALNGIPLGPIFLRDLGLDPTKFIKGSHHAHKLGVIEELLAFYPQLSFILVGDSGQHDAAIYAEVVRRHPGRVLAVYIRDVREGDEFDREALALLDEVRSAGASVAFCPDLLEAAVDAAAQGWITAADVAEVEREIQATPAA